MIEKLFANKNLLEIFCQITFDITFDCKSLIISFTVYNTYRRNAIYEVKGPRDI